MTHPMPEINTLLKQLRLPHVADNLIQRNREAIEGKLAYPEFLALLLQDEILGRENKKLQRRSKRANLNSNKTLENFDFNFNPKINRTQILELVSCRFISEKTPVLIVGPCGTGKSHLAQALAHSAIRRGIDVLWFSQHKLFGELQAARAAGRYQRKLAEFIKVPLLIIDDFALRPLRSPEDEDFHALISERYEQASTLVTSNLDFSEWGDAFPNRILAAATLDRLRHNADHIVLEGSSFREDRGDKSGKRKCKSI
jgi:DNA replication protein DnaC